MHSGYVYQLLDQLVILLLVKPRTHNIALTNPIQGYSSITNGLRHGSCSVETRSFRDNSLTRDQPNSRFYSHNTRSIGREDDLIDQIRSD